MTATNDKLDCSSRRRLAFDTVLRRSLDGIMRKFPVKGVVLGFRRLGQAMGSLLRACSIGFGGVTAMCTGSSNQQARDRCVGKSRCKLQPEKVAQIGDPCPGTHKRLVVELKCE